MVIKTCSRCREQKPTSSFYSHATLKTSDHLHSWCKDCLRQHRKSKWAKRPDVRAKATAQSKERASRTPRYRLAQARNAGLKRRPTDNPISIDQLIGLWVAQDGKCAVSGIPMTWSAGNQGGKKLPTSVSLDRIDNGRSYEPGNVRLVCDAFNAFRGEMTDQQMVEMAESLCRFQRRSLLKIVG